MSGVDDGIGLEDLGIWGEDTISVRGHRIRLIG